MQTSWGWLVESDGELRAVRQIKNIAQKAKGSTERRATRIFDAVANTVGAYFGPASSRPQATTVRDYAGRSFRRIPIELSDGQMTLRVYLVELQTGWAIAAITGSAAEEQRILGRIELGAMQEPQVATTDLARERLDRILPPVAPRSSGRGETPRPQRVSRAVSATPVGSPAPMPAPLPNLSVAEALRAVGGPDAIVFSDTKDGTDPAAEHPSVTAPATEERVVAAGRSKRARHTRPELRLGDIDRLRSLGIDAGSATLPLLALELRRAEERVERVKQLDRKAGELQRRRTQYATVLAQLQRAADQRAKTTGRLTDRVNELAGKIEKLETDVAQSESDSPRQLLIADAKLIRTFFELRAIELSPLSGNSDASVEDLICSGIDAYLAGSRDSTPSGDSTLVLSNVRNEYAGDHLEGPVQSGGDLFL